MSKTVSGLQRKYKEYHKTMGRKLDISAIIVLFGCNVNLTGMVHDSDIASAKKEIDAYYKSKVPKKKDVSIDINSPIGAREEAFNEGYNLAIDDFQKEE